MEEEVPMEITDKQWEIIDPLLPEPLSGPGKRGRPQRNNREVWDGILWILRTGAPWKDIPARYPPYQTCHRRFQSWSKDGTFERVLTALAMDLKERGGIDVREAFIDGTFASAKKGGPASGQLKRAKAPRSWQLQTAVVFLSPYASKVLRRMK